MERLTRSLRGIALVALFAWIGLGASSVMAAGTWNYSNLQLIDDGTLFPGTPNAILQFRPQDFAVALQPPGYVESTYGRPSYNGQYTYFVNPNDALGVPDRDQSTSHLDDPNSLSLGKGWQPRENFGASVKVRLGQPLQADGTSQPDLWIFETGETDDMMIVEISQNDSNWFNVGHFQKTHLGYTYWGTAGAGDPAGAAAIVMDGAIADTRVWGIDIDSFVNNSSIPAGDYLYVRIYDDGQDQSDNNSFGPDIDAIGVGGELVGVPEPGTLTLLGLAGLALLIIRRWRGK